MRWQVMGREVQVPTARAIAFVHVSVLACVSVPVLWDGISKGIGIGIDINIATKA